MRFRPLLACVGAALVCGCTQQVGGAAVPPMGARPAGVLDVDEVLLGLEQMRAVTDSAALMIVPGMNGKSPIDDADSAAEVPPPCRFLFSDSATFGSDHRDFTKTTYLIPPPQMATISEGAAAYRETAGAASAFTGLRAAAIGCAESAYGSVLIGQWKADADSLQMRLGTCGRDYRRKLTVLVEVTFCGFTDPTTEIVMSNILSRVAA